VRDPPPVPPERPLFERNVQPWVNETLKERVLGTGSRVQEEKTWKTSGEGGSKKRGFGNLESVLDWIPNYLINELSNYCLQKCQLSGCIGVCPIALSDTLCLDMGPAFLSEIQTGADF